MEDFADVMAKQGKQQEETAVVKFHPLDPTPALAEFAPLKPKVKAILEKAHKFEIKSDADEKKMVSITAKIGELHKQVEEVRKAYVKEPNAYVKKINNDAKEMTGACQKEQRICKQKLQQHIAAKELARRKAQELIDKKTQQLQQELNLEAEKSGVEAPQAAPIKLPETEGVARGEDGSTFYTRKKWVVEIETPEEVPREYCIPNQQLLDKAAEMGIREIPGCKVIEKHIPVIKGA